MLRTTRERQTRPKPVKNFGLVKSNEANLLFDGLTALNDEIRVASTPTTRSHAMSRDATGHRALATCIRSDTWGGARAPGRGMWTFSSRRNEMEVSPLFLLAYMQTPRLFFVCLDGYKYKAVARE